MSNNYEDSRSLQDGKYEIIAINWLKDEKDERYRRILSLRASTGSVTRISFHPTIEENGISLIDKILEKRICRDGDICFIIDL
jgi:hypothetical protein